MRLSKESLNLWIRCCNSPRSWNDEDRKCKMKEADLIYIQHVFVCLVSFTWNRFCMQTWLLMGWNPMVWGFFLSLQFSVFYQVSCGVGLWNACIVKIWQWWCHWFSSLFYSFHNSIDSMMWTDIWYNYCFITACEPASKSYCRTNPGELYQTQDF